MAGHRTVSMWNEAAYTNRKLCAVTNSLNCQWNNLIGPLRHSWKVQSQFFFQSLSKVFSESLPRWTCKIHLQDFFFPPHNIFSRFTRSPEMKTLGHVPDLTHWRHKTCRQSAWIQMLRPSTYFTHAFCGRADSSIITLEFLSPSWRCFLQLLSTKQSRQNTHSHTPSAEQGGRKTFTGRKERRRGDF